MANATLRAAEAELLPPADSTDNDNINDVAGNKTDAAQTTVGTTRSLMAYIKGLLNQAELLMDHVHGVAKVYPTLAVGVAVASPASAGGLGNFTEIVPANTIAADYDIHGIKVEAFNTTATYELVLYQGASDVEIGRCRITRDTNQATTPYVPFMSPIVPANARIRAKVANNTAGAASITISLMYHTY